MNAGLNAGGFGRLLHAEWTKLRTVRGWVASLLAGAAVIVALGLLPGVQGSCGQNGPGSECALPTGPGGEEVTDSFTFVHRSLSGDGTLTARVTSLTGQLPAESRGMRPGVVPWAKAGLVVKAGTRPGSAYAAAMVTGEHGVRLQYNYVHDRAGSPAGVSAEASRWLRLTRAGDTVTADESVDGSRWTTIGTARLPGLPATVEVGLFVTAPQYAAEAKYGVLTGVMGGPTEATATFEQISAGGGWSGAQGQPWTGTILGAYDGPDTTADNGPVGGAAPSAPADAGGLPGISGAQGSHGPAPGPRRSYAQTADGFTLTGSGDIAPAVSGATGLGTSITQTLAGTFLGLIFIVVVGTMFITAEYRRGLVRTTVSASPRRGRILAAKAIVLGGATFVVALVAAAVVVTFGQRVLRGNGVYVHPAGTVTELRVIAGTAALLAVCAVLALGLGALLRRSVTAVTTAIVVVVLPYLLAVSVLPAAAAQWMLRVTPAAAFALQQSTTQYAQVDNVYTPASGYFPLSPWAGLAVLAGWTALVLAAAVALFRRRDT